MDVVMMEPGIARPGLFLRGLIELAQIRSLCTWGAVILAAVAALGSIVRALRKTVRWLRLHRARVAIPGGGMGGGGFTGSIVPEPSVDFTDDDDDDDGSVSECGGSEASWSDSDDSVEEEEVHRVGCAVDDESETESESEEEEHSEPLKRRYQQQDWGFGMGGWESWFGGGRVVKHWEQIRDGTKGFIPAESGGVEGCGYGGFVPLIRSFCFDTPSLTLSCPDGLDLRLCDSRLPSSVPAAMIAPVGIRKRAAVGVRAPGDGVVGGGGNRVLYVAERGGGSRAVVDLRNTKAVVGTEEGSSEDTWWDADPVFVSSGY